jgi:hypothetical protein
MSRSRPDRIRGDLETIREAAGLSLPFGWEDVWMGLALVPVGATIALAATFAPLRVVRLVMVLVVVVALAATAGLRIRFRRSTRRSPIRRREYTVALTGLLTALIMVVQLRFEGKGHEPVAH